MVNVFLVPAKKEHLHSVSDGVPLNFISDFLADNEKENINKLYNNKAFLWGTLPSRKRVWELMKKGDIVLFKQTGTGYYGYCATIAFTTHNKKLAERVWKTDGLGRTWEYVFFIQGIKEFEIDPEKINVLVGYAKNFWLPGITQVGPATNKRIMTFLNKYEDSEIEYSEESPETTEKKNYIKLSLERSRISYAKPGRRLLTTNEIKEMVSLIRQDFQYKISLRKENILAEKIKFTPLPSSLTESLAIHLLRKLSILPELKNFDIDFGGRISDIIAKDNKIQKKIEVKATGESAFQYFGEKDITADYIIWIHFDDFFMRSDKQNVKIYIIKDPNKHFSKPTKITIDQLKQIIKNDLIITEFSMDSF